MCIGNDCNVLPRIQECYACDSSVDEYCLSPNIGTRSKTCATYSDKCITHIDGGRVRRGCLLELDEVNSECSGNNGTRCEVCEGPGCNARSVVQEFCYDCNSALNSSCVNSVVGANLKACTGTELNFDRRGCYRWEADGKQTLSFKMYLLILYFNQLIDGSVVRGCVNDLPNNSQSICQEQGNCKTCFNNECNEKPTFQTCHSCDSTVDPLCIDLVTNPLAGAAGQCVDYLDSCKTLITTNGKTVRGCTSTLQRTPSSIFDECVDSNCNGRVYPQDRRRCYQCSGSGCSDALQETSSNYRYCENYVRDDQCYGYSDSKHHITEYNLGQLISFSSFSDVRGMNRGCLSDNATAICGETGALCTFCTGSDGCNGEAQYRPSLLSCIQCAGTEECQWGFGAARATPCEQMVGYGKSQSCYTSITASQVVSRGCRIVLDQDVCSGDQCTHCTGAGCNGQNVVSQRCQSCRSDVNGQEICREEDVIGFEQQCGTTNEVIEYANRGCYIKNQSMNTWDKNAKEIIYN